jgi:mannose-6-phosphate isomerase-like protein (cupin superfamily)
MALCATLAFLLFAFVASVGAADQAGQVIANYADILKANPMPAGAKAQAIKVADDDTATLSIVRFAPGVDVAAHFHKTHTETLYIIEGSGQMTVEGKTVEIKPGTVIHVPVGKVHAAKNTGSVDLVAFQIFAPSMPEPQDRVPVP